MSASLLLAQSLIWAIYSLLTLGRRQCQTTFENAAKNNCRDQNRQSPGVKIDSKKENKTINNDTQMYILTLGQSSDAVEILVSLCLEAVVGEERLNLEKTMWLCLFDLSDSGNSLSLAFDRVDLPIRVLWAICGQSMIRLAEWLSKTINPNLFSEVMEKDRHELLWFLFVLLLLWLQNNERLKGAGKWSTNNTKMFRKYLWCFINYNLLRKSLPEAHFLSYCYLV